MEREEIEQAVRRHLCDIRIAVEHAPTEILGNIERALGALAASPDVVEVLADLAERRKAC